MKTIKHSEDPDFWRYEDERFGTCFHCGKYTIWVYLDLGWTHPLCERHADYKLLDESHD